MAANSLGVTSMTQISYVAQRVVLAMQIQLLRLGHFPTVQALTVVWIWQVTSGNGALISKSPTLINQKVLGRILAKGA